MYLKQRKKSLVILQIQKKGPQTNQTLFYRTDTGETSVTNDLVINQRQNARNVKLSSSSQQSVNTAIKPI